MPILSILKLPPIGYNLIAIYLNYPRSGIILYSHLECFVHINDLNRRLTILLGHKNPPALLLIPLNISVTLILHYILKLSLIVLTINCRPTIPNILRNNSPTIHLLDNIQIKFRHPSNRHLLIIKYAAQSISICAVSKTTTSLPYQIKFLLSYHILITIKKNYYYYKTINDFFALVTPTYRNCSNTFLS